jgi:hypothetical protein
MADQRFKVFKRGSSNRSIILRLTKAEYAELEMIANEADIGVSTTAKQLLRQALARGVVVVEEAEPPPEPEEEQPEAGPDDAG